MISEKTLRSARSAAEELRQRGDIERARAIETLVDAVEADVLPSLDLLTSTATGELLGVSGQTIKNWVRQGRLQGFRVGGRVMIPRDAVEEYVRRARQSLEPDILSDEEAAQLVGEGRGSQPRVESREQLSPLGKELVKIREEIVSSGESLLSWDELDREIAERRGEVT